MMDSITSSLTRLPGRDVVIAAAFTALGLLLMYINVNDHAADPAQFEENTAVYYGGILPYGFALPLFPLVTVPLAWRRVAPIAAVQVALAGLVLNELLVGTDVIRCGVVFPIGLMFAFTAGAQLQGRESFIGLAWSLAVILVDGIVEFEPVVPAFMCVVALAIWGIGRVVQSRARMADELEARTAELREARDERARIEVATDRARISADLDQLLQRRLAELGRMANEARPEGAAEATATLVDIEREGRRTLDEMRAVVGVLRDESAEAPTSPQPTLTHLEALLLRDKGGEARLIVEGNPRVLPPAVELAAYRITEQLLAALDDAPDIEVRVRFGDGALELAVSGPARRRAKVSMERARERARLQQGTFEATVRGGRAEAAVSLPVLAAV